MSDTRINIEQACRDIQSSVEEDTHGIIGNSFNDQQNEHYSLVIANVNHACDYITRAFMNIEGEMDGVEQFVHPDRKMVESLQNKYIDLYRKYELKQPETDSKDDIKDNDGQIEHDNNQKIQQKNVNDEEKYLSPQDSNNEQFLKFLRDCRMEKYHDKFVKNECNDFESVQLFDDDLLKQEIGVENKILRKKFLIKCNEINNDMNEFRSACGINKFLYDKLSKYGIVTLSILCDLINDKQDLKIKYELENDNQCDLLWKLKKKYENENIEQQYEGS